MTTLRTSFYLLLLFNIACGVVVAMPWLGVQPPFLGAVEPNRMLSQVFPDKLTVLATSLEPPSASTPEAVPPLTSLPSESASGVPAAEGASEPVGVVSASDTVADAAATVCVAFRNLNGIQAQALAQRARSEGNELTVREEAAAPSSFWVNIPQQGGKVGAERRVADLKKLGLEDFFVVQDVGPTRYAISLGSFRNESLAERKLETLQKLGVKGAKVSPRENVSGARVELTGVSAKIERVARDGASEIQGAVRDSCKAG